MEDELWLINVVFQVKEVKKYSNNRTNKKTNNGWDIVNDIFEKTLTIIRNNQ